jgi:SAM-dependent methyltransferase
MNAPLTHSALVEDELSLLSGLVPLAGCDIIELGCGAAPLARALVRRYPDAHVTGLEVDERQHAKNLAAPQSGLQFGGRRAGDPLGDARFDLVLMLKSLHHVPLALMATALHEAARVLRPDGHLYVSGAGVCGSFNDVVRLYNEEGAVRAAAQAALDEALKSDDWAQVADVRFEMPVHFKDFAAFEQRMMRPTFADHQIDEMKLAQVRAAFAPHCGPQGASFSRLMHARLLRRRS